MLRPESNSNVYMTNIFNYVSILWCCVCAHLSAAVVVIGIFAAGTRKFSENGWKMMMRCYQITWQLHVVRCMTPPASRPTCANCDNIWVVRDGHKRFTQKALAYCVCVWHSLTIIFCVFISLDYDIMNMNLNIAITRLLLIFRCWLARSQRKRSNEEKKKNVHTCQEARSSVYLKFNAWIISVANDLLDEYNKRHDDRCQLIRVNLFFIFYYFMYVIEEPPSSYLIWIVDRCFQFEKITSSKFICVQ